MRTTTLETLVIIKTLVIIICAYAYIMVPMAVGAECAALTPETRRALISYVGQRYEVASISTIGMEETGVERSCYRHVRFFSTTPERPFETTLFLSPDHKFLVPELFGVLEDPVNERNFASSLLQHRLAPPESPSLGGENARVMIVMFTDFQCGFCREAADVIEKEILPENRDKVRFTIRHHPLPSHGWARSAAEIGICASLQGSDIFWSLHDYIFKAQREISADNLKVKSLNFLSTLPRFDTSAFENCITSPRPKEALLNDENIGQNLGVNATPTFFINGAKQVGIGDPKNFKTLITQYIRSPGN